LVDNRVARAEVSELHGDRVVADGGPERGRVADVVEVADDALPRAAVEGVAEGAELAHAPAVPPAVADQVDVIGRVGGRRSGPADGDGDHRAGDEHQGGQPTSGRRTNSAGHVFSVTGTRAMSAAPPEP